MDLAKKWWFLVALYLFIGIIFAFIMNAFVFSSMFPAGFQPPFTSFLFMVLAWPIILIFRNSFLVGF